MSKTSGAFYKSKNDFFHAFLRVTLRSMLGIAVFLALLVIVFT